MADTHKHLDDSLRVTVIGSILNVVLIVFKLTLGILGHSRALVADGLHSMTDLMTDAILIGGLIVGAKPTDESHHYGHGKVEILVEMALGSILVLAGILIIYDSGRALLHPPDTGPSLFVIPAALFSVISKEWLYRITMRTARSEGRPALVANAWHHRSDALSSVGVLLAVSLAIIHPAFAVADPLVGFFVALLVIGMGGKIGWNAALRIIDTAPSGDFMERVSRMIREIPDVRSIRNLRMRYVGRLIAVEVHLGLDPEMTIDRGHEVASEVKRSILERDSRVFDVLVHMEPENGEPRQRDVRARGEFRS
ncbi:MAG: cation transporter [Deltaproteobacteria bacterium]|nr:cation transporter [Deltaproteobacteria bacterium]